MVLRQLNLVVHGRYKVLMIHAASHTTDVVTFYNAKDLITSNAESGINVTWDATNENFDFNVNDPTLTFTGDVTGTGTLTNLGNLSVALTVAA